MATSNNGTVAKVVASVISAVLIFVILQVLGNTNRITALETDMRALKETVILMHHENRDEHKAIAAKLDAIKEYVKK